MKMCVHSITAFMIAAASGGALCHPATQRVPAPIYDSLIISRSGFARRLSALLPALAAAGACSHKLIEIY